MVTKNAVFMRSVAFCKRLKSHHSERRIKLSNLWRIYKRNRFRELFLVGTDKKSEVPDTIKQSHTIK